MSEQKPAVHLYLCLILIDLIFHALAFGTFSAMSLLRMALANLAIACLINALFGFSAKAFRWAGAVVLVLLGIYGFVQLQFRNFIETFYSVQALADGGFRVGGFVLYFLQTAKPAYLLCLLPALLFLISARRAEGVAFSRGRSVLTGLLAAALVCVSVLQDNGNLGRAVQAQDNFDTIIAGTGINTFLFEDLTSLFRDRSEQPLTLSSVTEEESEPAIAARQFDDSRWQAVMAEETDETMKTIDGYLMNRPLPETNEMTGVFEGYNLIYFLVESLDYAAIDPELTPTIWKMMNGGFFFPEHYTPVFSCGTGDSEFVGMTSMMPYGSSCTVYTVINHDLHNSLGGLFADAGYATHSFHNWDDEFYDRTTLHASYGIEEYLDSDDLNIELVQGWQSDEVLAERALPYFINDERFFTFFVTSTMHWPYDIDSYYGNAYLEQINEVHPDYPPELKRLISKTMEFDHMLKTLTDALQEAGKLDTTVFCFWPDHHPFNISPEYLKAHTSIVDRYTEYGFNRSPLILYCAGLPGEQVDQVCSTFDHLPTLANLFNLNYDPRLYMGSDIFGGDCHVIFPNSDWISNDGIYINSTGDFHPAEGKEVDAAAIEKTDVQIKDLISAGRAMVSTDYFAAREFLVSPVKTEPETETEP